MYSFLKAFLVLMKLLKLFSSVKLTSQVSLDELTPFIAV